MNGLNCTKYGQYKGLLSALHANVSFIFQIRFYFDKRERVKGHCGRKSRPIFALFHPRKFS